MATLQNPAALLRPATPKNQPASGWQTTSPKNQPERLHLDIDQRDKDGATALIRAAEKGDLKTVRTLLENGADINAADKNGWTALMKAVKGHHLKTPTFMPKHATAGMFCPSRLKPARRKSSRSSPALPAKVKI